MATGKVKWFNNAKGYGFILPEAGGEDLFAHFSSIEMDGYKTLKAGQDVEFEVVEGPKGQHAVEIRAGDEESAESGELDGSEPVDVVVAGVDLAEAEPERPEGEAELTPQASSEIAN
jgi:CspA family cold shock protein